MDYTGPYFRLQQERLKQPDRHGISLLQPTAAGALQVTYNIHDRQAALLNMQEVRDVFLKDHKRQSMNSVIIPYVCRSYLQWVTLGNQLIALPRNLCI